MKRRDTSDEVLKGRRRAVVREAAIQRKFGAKGRRRRKRLPRQIPPTPIVVTYSKALRTLVRSLHEIYAPVIAAFKSRARTDADFSPALKREAARRTQSEEFSPAVKVQGREAARLLGEAERRLASIVSTSAVENLATQFAARTNVYQKTQLDRQVRAALGADPFVAETGLNAAAEDFVAQNVSLITRIPKRLHEKVEGMVMQAATTGQRHETLAGEIEKQLGIAERHAALIARDQISKFYGNLNRQRQANLGVKKFIWRTVNDERVRDEHAALEGEEYPWEELPTNDKGEPIFPGSEINCRCWSEPVLDDLADDMDEAEDELEPADDELDPPDYIISLDPEDYEE